MNFQKEKRRIETGSHFISISRESARFVYWSIVNSELDMVPKKELPIRLHPTSLMDKYATYEFGEHEEIVVIQADYQEIDKIANHLYFYASQVDSQEEMKSAQAVFSEINDGYVAKHGRSNERWSKLFEQLDLVSA